MKPKILYSARANFESARYLAQYPAQHKLHRVHGHSFFARLRTDYTDYADSLNECITDQLEAQLRQCVAPLDYDLLNEHVYNPSDENLALWIRDRIEISQFDLVMGALHPNQVKLLDL